MNTKATSNAKGESVIVNMTEQEIIEYESAMLTLNIITTITEIENEHHEPTESVDRPSSDGVHNDLDVHREN